MGDVNILLGTSNKRAAGICTFCSLLNWPYVFWNNIDGNCMLVQIENVPKKELSIMEMKQR